MISKKFLVLTVVSVFVAMTGCTKDEPKKEEPATPAPTEAAKPTETKPSEAAVSSAPTAQEAKVDEVKELQKTDVKVGTGAEAVSGKKVKVHYTGNLLNGTKFDSSKDRGEPFEFTLGAGQVIKGWDVGVAGMKVGGVRQLLIPASMAYGERGIGPIPPNSPLKFEVELLGVQ